jgi:4-amino-4-deoxy-L-arabinose transferase-like glycosyltransferase
MNILYYQNLQESQTYYDHPYFGQILLAGLFAFTGFPDSLNPSPTVQSIETLYLFPKFWIGLFAIVDTFLIYKIVNYRYKDHRVAFFAALLFAVMPMSWITRRVLLESLLLPFLLTSILLALQLRNANGDYKRHVLLLMSGICIGLAIFTKAPALAAMPLIGFLIYSSSTRYKLRSLGLWLIPGILIPLLWPAYSISEGQFDYWARSLLSQTERKSDGIATIFWNFWKVDPVLLILGSVGTGYSILIKRDYFPLLWILPFLTLFSFAGYVQYFHVIPLLPAFCISSALWLNDVISGLWRTRVKLFQVGTMASLGTFGLVVTTLVITTDMTSSQFEAAAFVLWSANEDTTIIASPAYSWVYNFLLYMPYALTDYRDAIYSPLPTNRIILISDPHFQANFNEARQLQELHERTSTVQTFYGDVKRYDTDSYPYTSLSLCAQGELVDIRQYPAP